MQPFSAESNPSPKSLSIPIGLDELIPAPERWSAPSVPTLSAVQPLSQTVLGHGSGLCPTWAIWTVWIRPSRAGGEGGWAAGRQSVPQQFISGPESGAWLSLPAVKSQGFCSLCSKKQNVLIYTVTHLSLKAFLVFGFSPRKIGDVAHHFNLFIKTFINLMHSNALNFLVWWSYLPKAIFTKHNANSALGKSLGLAMKRSAVWLAHGTCRERAQRL